MHVDLECEGKRVDLKC